MPTKTEHFKVADYITEKQRKQHQENSLRFYDPGLSVQSTTLTFVRSLVVVSSLECREKSEKDLTLLKVQVRPHMVPRKGMRSRRRTPLILLRMFLTVAICLIPFMALAIFSIHLHRVPSLRDQKFNDKVPTLNGSNEESDYEKLWKPPSTRGFMPCTKPTPSYTTPAVSRGYLLVHTNGGLNQMRAGICDMVAIARIINATLVIPELDKKSFWKDTSNFYDIFDEEMFMNSLANDVKIIKKLPKELVNATRMIRDFKSWSGMDYYENEIARFWEHYQVIQSSKSDTRLANNNLPPDIQKLRCRACFEALRFSPSIEQMGKLLVERMRSFGPYIALHLRYEKDILAFSGCTHDLSKAEAKELQVIRENTSYWKRKNIDPREERYKGVCPLTPKEVGIFLTALGYPSNTPIYIASGEIFGGESHMAELRLRYPFLMSKEKLASIEELEPFSNHASQMAALDYIVSVESDVFIPSYSGNMARIVQGHRRFLGRGRTISPDKKALVRLFDKLDQGKLTEGKTLSKKIIDLHKTRLGTYRKRKGAVSGTKGADRFRSEEAFYANPLPDCLCRPEPPHLNASHIVS